MKEKLYDYENFSKCKELLHEFKNNNKKKFGNIFYIVFYENWRIFTDFQIFSDFQKKLKMFPK